MQVPQKGGSPSQPEDKILAVTFTWLLDVKNIETQFHHHKMPTKDIDDRRIPILPTTPIDYIKGFRQYPMNFWLCTLLLFLVELGCAILAAPSPMLLETAVCRHHFKKDRQLLNGEPTDEFCRSNEVQVHFAFVITVLSTLSTLAATMMQVPMGMLGDKGGIRLAFMLNATSTIFYWGCIAVVGSQHHFPLWGFYLSPMFILLGGGPWATGTLVFAAISDSFKPEQRTTAFSIMEAISGIADLLGPIIGTMTMSIHLGIPFALALVVFSLIFIPASHLRENAVSDMEGVRSSPAETESLLSVDSASAREQTDLEHTARDLLPPRAAGLLFSLRAIMSSLLYFVILPLATSWIDQTWQSANRDLALSASGAFCCTLGTLIVAAAPNLATVAFGFALSVLGSSMTVTLRSFLASNVQNAFSGRLFASISMTGTIGSLVGMPIMGAAYSLGINYNIGLPFLVSALSYFLVLGLLVWLASRI
ncbi:Major facilitator superfamily [Fusarium oxysporum f. sp. vasinfectum]|nr:Major facilitator superfamily [Fusarium oxysporum f. sp. vasinfectum]